MHIVDFLVERAHHVGHVYLLTVALVHDFDDEKQLEWVLELLLDEYSEERILHESNLSGLLLVLLLNFRLKHVSEGLTDDGDEQVEENDHVEDDTDDEDNPVCVPVLCQVFVEPSERRQER